MTSSPSARVIDKASWQSKLFVDIPKRRDLISFKSTWPRRKICLRVHRNMPFEFIAGILSPFCAFADLEVETILSDYDDALNFSNLKDKVDCELIWLDFTRYAEKMNEEECVRWLQQRLQTLRGHSDAAILIADGGGISFDKKLAALVETIPDIQIFPRRQLEERLGSRWTDTRMQQISAHIMSDDAIMITAQALGLAWLPAATETPLKAIVLDLDNTLYKGVLGEDGSEELELTPPHKALQEKLRMLGKQGLFLALLSRNERVDVEKLFLARHDFPLRWEHFSATHIGWREKSQGLESIAAQLHIHPSAMLVLDDNIGEIAEMSAAHPSTSYWHAENPSLTLHALDLFPRLLRWRKDKTDELRAYDLKMSQARAAELAQTSSSEDYLRSLGLVLNFSHNPQNLRGRLTDLANKTNQFALGLARLNETEIARRFSDPLYATYAVNLSDRLSDSGVIAAIFCHAEDQTLAVDDICISCRALGRQVEDVIISTALNHAQQKFGTRKIAFAYNRGPRNNPARDWLAKFTGMALPNDHGQRIVEWKDISDKIINVPVAINWGSTKEAA